jgi:hypothetical protein
VRETRLHDARHTAATVLLALEVPERTVMGVMGWSSTSMPPGPHRPRRRFADVVSVLVSVPLLWGPEARPARDLMPDGIGYVLVTRGFLVLTRAEDAGFEPARA